MHAYQLGRQRLKRSCTRKLRYEQEIAALLRAADIWKNGGPHMRAYGCPHCGGWHLARTTLLTQEVA